MIYFAFQSSNSDDLIKTGIAYVHPEFDYVIYNGMIFGMLHSHKWQHRVQLDALDTRMMALPGPCNGKLTKGQAKHITPVFPKIMEGDAMSIVLQELSNQTGHEGFNLNHY